MATVADVIEFLQDQTQHAQRAADQFAAFGRIGADEAEAMVMPACEYARKLAELAQAAEALDAAARAVFTAKGRHHTQLAMCNLGDLLGIETVRP